MPEIILSDRKFDIDGFIFDKDGTLIDFHSTWGPILGHAIDLLITPLENKTLIRENMFKTLGVDQLTLQAGDGPYAISTFDKICTVVTTVLYQHGITWTDAEQRVDDIFKPAALTPPSKQQLIQTTDLPGLFNELKAQGIHIGIATADNRHGTLDTLSKLDCQSEALFIACGDDAGLPSKPDPTLLHVIAENWGTSTDRIAMVGDTIGDVYMARQAGAISIGVLTGAGTTEILMPYTDIILSSIDQIHTALRNQRNVA